jgi:hypothetical protein
MGKKAAVAEAVAGKAKAETPPSVSATVAAGDDLEALLSAGGTQAVETKTASSSVAEVKLAEVLPKDEAEETSKNLLKFIEQSAREKAAKGRKESLGEDIKGIVKKVFSAFCRKQKVYHKTICLNGVINFGSIQLKVAAPDKKKGTTSATIKAGLKALFGAAYENFVEDTYVLQVRPEIMENRAEAVAAVKLLQEKLGADFARLLVYSQDIGLKEIGPDKDKIVVLKRDALFDPAVDAKVTLGIEQGFLTDNMGALTPQKSALAVAEEKMLDEEKQRQSVTITVAQKAS